MPDHTTASAAQYLAERGYTAHSKRDGTDKAPSADTIKRWCLRKKIPGARKVIHQWLIPQKALDKLLAKRKEAKV